MPVQVPRLPGLFTVFFSDQPVRDYEGAKAADADRYGAFCRALLERGVYPPASQFEAWFPSLAHTPEHVERTVAGGARGLRGAVSALARGRRRRRPGACGSYAVAEPRAAAAGYGDFVLEAVREGYELHYGAPRAFAGMDDDLRLLAGDALYALGLSRLAETGDLEPSPSWPT